MTRRMLRLLAFEWRKLLARRTTSLAVIGVLVAYMGCHAIGVDAYSLSRAWRSDPWQAAVVAWDSGDQASSVRVSAAFSDRLGSEIPCLGST